MVSKNSTRSGLKMRCCRACISAYNKYRREKPSSVLCGCGCGEHVNGNSNFLRGHASRTPERRAQAKANLSIIAKQFAASPEGKRRLIELGKKNGNSVENLSRLKAYNASPESKAARDKAREKSKTPEAIEKLRHSSITRAHTLNGIAQMAKMNSEWHGSPEGKLQLKKLWETWSRTPEGISNLRKAHLKWIRTPEGMATSRESMLKALRASRPSPTNLEQRLFAVFLHYGLPFDFVGNERSNPIGGKYPDFIHQDKKIIVEIANKEEKEFRYNKKMRKIGKEPYPSIGQYWKKYEKDRTSLFRDAGYECVMLWEDMKDEEIVMKVGTACRAIS